MTKPQHHRAFAITVVWTLGLLLLGSVVHATESSLACPDWPTCFGTMVPEMTGGVFWEHLHRLVAGGLMLFFALGIYLTWREKPRYPWVLKAAWAGFGLLLVQAVFGGLTVLLLLPDAISTSHLGMAFLFLALAAVLTVVTGPDWGLPETGRWHLPRSLRIPAILSASVVFAQSIVGAGVRHTDAGMACPDIPLCLGEWVPPLSHPLVILHFSHRALGIVALGMVLWVGHLAFWRGKSTGSRILGISVAALAAAQVTLGFLSVYYRLAVVPVSVHTLLAATLLTLLVMMATQTWAPSASAPNTPGEIQ